MSCRTIASSQVSNALELKPEYDTGYSFDVATYYIKSDFSHVEVALDVLRVIY